MFIVETTPSNTSDKMYSIILNVNIIFVTKCKQRVPSKDNDIWRDLGISR